MGTKEFKGPGQDGRYITHGICPQCRKKLMAELEKALEKQIQQNKKSREGE
jgi:hypothetical protein